MADKVISVAEIMKKLNKDAGTNVISYGVSRDVVPKIPFSSPRANYCTYGGIPKYRLVEFFGPESAGKTTAALDIIGQYQKLPDAKSVLYIDYEHTFDPEWAAVNGVNVDTIIVFQPDSQSAEDIFDLITDFVKTDEVGFVLLDSLGSLIPEQIMDESMEKLEMCGIAKSLTRFCKTIIPKLQHYKCTAIFINQVRDDINSQWNKFKTVGGNAFRHFCSLRLMFSEGPHFKEDGSDATLSYDTPAGHKIDMFVKKTKVCRPDRKKGFMTLDYRAGIDAFKDTVDCAIEFNLIFKAGGWFTIYDPETGEEVSKVQGQLGVVKYLKSNIELYNKIWQHVNNKLSEEG